MSAGFTGTGIWGLAGLGCLSNLQRAEWRQQHLYGAVQGPDGNHRRQRVCPQVRPHLLAARPFAPPELMRCWWPLLVPSRRLWLHAGALGLPSSCMPFPVLPQTCCPGVTQLWRETSLATGHSALQPQGSCLDSQAQATWVVEEAKRYCRGWTERLCARDTGDGRQVSRPDPVSGASGNVLMEVQTWWSELTPLGSMA